MKARILLLNKPYEVCVNSTYLNGRKTLADFIPEPGFYPAGRLDYKSEGLALLTNSGALQHRISDPKFKLRKIYWVQVQGNSAAGPWLLGSPEGWSDLARRGRTHPAADDLGPAIDQFQSCQLRGFR